MSPRKENIEVDSDMMKRQNFVITEKPLETFSSYDYEDSDKSPDRSDLKSLAQLTPKKTMVQGSVD